MLKRIGNRIGIAILGSASVTLLFYVLNHSSMRNVVAVALEPSIKFVCRYLDANCFTHKFSGLEVYTVNFLLCSVAILLLLLAKDLFGAWKQQQTRPRRI